MRFFKLQRYTAIALVAFMALHMVVVHYPPGHLDFSRVLERLGNPLWKVIDIAFLATVLLHGLGGLYDVLIDVEQLTPARRALAGVLVVVGLVAFAYGTYTVISFNPMALAALR
jgi:succinate dehydrogenase / fumarate reductase membrane anchor subunit